MALSSQPLQPLSVGNVVSASVRLYGNHFKQYLGIAFIASLWSVLPTVVNLVLQLIFFGSPNPSPSQAASPLWALIRFGILILTLYCTAKSLMNAALISRLAFGELTERPETTQSARDQLKPITTRFLVTQILIALLYVAIILGLAIGLLILFGGAAVVLGQSPLAMLLLSLIVAVAVLFLFLWFGARWFIAELALAIEENVSSSGAIGRSWKLTKGYAVRILTITLVAGLITLPFYFVALVPLISVIVSNAPRLSQLEPGASNPAALGTIAQVTGGFLLSILLFAFLNVFVMPFWQSLKSLVYLDLRTRQEGLGLQLRDRNPPTT